MAVVISKFQSILYLAIVCSAMPGSAQTAVPAQIPATAQASKPAQGRTHKPSGAKKQQRATPAATPQPATPQGPLQPITLGQLPALPPQVSYNGGKLTITAQNSTLGDILRAVRSQTASSFDVPPNATERVVGRFGPGPAREVLVSLLNGSHFDYVMLGSATDPNAVAQLILTPKSGFSPDNAAQANQGPNIPGQANPYTQPMNPNVQAQIPQQMPSDGAGEGDNTPDNPEENTEQAEQPENQGDQEGAPQGLPQQPNGQPAVKTPQQLLQELQQQQLQQQQLQQQQQQQGQPGQNPPGQPPVVYPNPQVNQPPRND